MKTRSLVTLLATPLLLLASALCISNPQNLTYPVNSYQKWTGYVINGNAATGSSSILVQLQGIQLPSQSNPYNPLGGAAGEAFVPILVDQDAVTPTVVTCGIQAPTGVNVPGNGFLCNVTASWGAVHGNGSPISTNDAGLQEAINDAFMHGGGLVVVDGTSGASAALIAATVLYPNVSIADRSQGQEQFWNLAPSTTTALAAPTTLTPQLACDATHQFCSDATVAGSASWGSTIYGCYTLVDINGNESPCSSTQNFTSAASKAIDMGVSLTARTDNVVGWKPYSSVSGGSYALAYSWPLLTQPTVLLAVPVSAGVCTLTTLESITPACAIANSTYNQAGSTVGVSTLFKGGAQFTGYPVVTNTLAPEIGSASATAYNPNEEAHATYAPAPGNRVGFPGLQGAHIAFPITAAAQTTVGEVEASIPLSANFMNYPGRTIEVCGLIAKTSTTADTVDKIQVWWDAEGSNVTAGTPVQLSSINITEATALAAAANFQFCQQLETTVASTSATGGTIAPVQGSATVSQVSAGANPSAGSSSLVAAVGSLNLALPAHLSVLLVHTTGTDGAGSILYGATVRVVN